MEKEDNVNELKLIKAYSRSVKNLRKRKIIRSKNITGDLGEHYAKIYFENRYKKKFVLESPSNKSFDATCNGEKYAIKTISTSTTSVFYGVTNKENRIFDYLIIVEIDETYQPKEIIKMDWDTFFEYKKQHKTMKAPNISVTNILRNDKRTYVDSDPKKTIFNQ